ncbi:acyl-CoA thioesterase [Campylobacter hyointestinalis subsp. hyointestinalis]|nr:4-hydroxybenzoyl-CoA thioesterase [Campylobacter hyointestinalis subsp. hyointestinalis]PPB54151.1 4-hydroxybenzoyl-CoA thioesterase [Campylobacter hyointestinalis subsp. hyointestinalis]PPB55761.1 4-hydroxybenzoyl-CoA thioesterase [Campylobacter hyointestinalis subsp. hyointestinalis]PPB58923.1 4-hydroxybenzoyl-CoA thioesterase [Campylobacter hyointestinalis subsp. hyointestinalis]PPB62792.1 4-hydroxybenzoyl-CoA thioesterase [Campylobacter hyointestinalis subsp. hyointestinalis]
MMKTYKTKVEFYDVDSMNVVWHGNYVKFIEKARCEFLQDLGYDYEMMKKEGFAYPVAKMDFKFIKPLFFKDEIEIKVKLLQIDGFLKLKYEIFNKNAKKVCVATTSQVCVDIKSMQSVYEAPKTLRELVKGIL